MMKKNPIFMVGCLLFSTGLFSVELGLIGGTITNPSHLNYGLSTSLRFLVPLVKFEFELYRQVDTEEPELPNAITAGIKFQPKFGRFMPYAVVGISTEFKSFSLDFDEYEAFTFIGGGIHYKLIALLSIRADLRFLNFSTHNRTRLTAGLFFHI
ncbi:MAG: hypothetical protein JSV88_32025 [Candidatus Aminicenantes bacterium]|nr:MAG: hypothetical protein JSV88_32025 [Candidatus Aminicenantes bacterium]